MSNRRRSERYGVQLPVWLKDGRGGERTHTVDVSAHGIAVLAGHARPLRQYVELELRLQDPEASIAVTAVVARHAELLHPESGAPVTGLGLDFFLFDAQAKATWQAFIRRLHEQGPVVRPPPVSPPPPVPEPPEEEDDTPTFIIKPRDLGRLWAFFRGEMAKGMVRIETPILKPTGSAAELLVVHPTSLAEWALPGRVVRATEAGRGGRPVLEIGLTPLDADGKAAFRNYVATGRGQVEEEILISSEIALPEAAHLRSEAPARPTPPDRDDEPERIESVVIDLDNLDDLEDALGGGDATPGPSDFEEVSLGSGLIAAPPRFLTHPVGATPSGLVAASAVAAASDEPPEDDPTQHAPAPSLPPPRREVEERPTSVFASFFAEAGLDDAPAPAAPVQAWAHHEITAESQLDLSAVSRAKSQARRTPPPLPPSALEPTPEPELVPRAEGPEADLQPPTPEEPIPLVKRRSAAPPPPPPAAPPPMPRQAVPPLPPSARIRSAAPAAASAAPRSRRRPDDDPSVQVRPVALPPAPEAPVPLVAGRPDQAQPNPLAATNPPVPPGQMFDFGDPSQPNIPRARHLAEPREPSGLVITPRSDPSAKVKPPARGAIVERSAEPRPADAASGNGPRRGAARRSPVEHQERAFEHRMISTEGTNPGLDRDIALARARMVRSPHSVTACYRLSALLLQRSESGGLDEAVQALEKVMTLEPNHPGAHHKLAELHARKGDYERAAEHLNRARRLGYQVDPDLERLIANASRGA